MGRSRKKPIDCPELKKILIRLGFHGQPGKGAHEKWVHPCLKGRKRHVIVSCHNAPFHRKILYLMIEQMGLTRDEFAQCRESLNYAEEFGRLHGCQADIT